MPAGALAFIEVNATGGVVVSYSPTATFVSGVLTAQSLGNGSESTIAASGGLNTFTGLTPGLYAFYMDENDISGLSGRSNVVLVDVPVVPTAAQDLQIEFRGDATAFESQNKPLDLMRLSLYTNRSCHLFMWRLSCDAQNARNKIRSVNYHLRQRARPGTAETRYGS